MLDNIDTTLIISHPLHPIISCNDQTEDCQQKNNINSGWECRTSLMFSGSNFLMVLIFNLSVAHCEIRFQLDLCCFSFGPSFIMKCAKIVRQRPVRWVQLTGVSKLHSSTGACVASYINKTKKRNLVNLQLIKTCNDRRSSFRSLLQLQRVCQHW